MKRETRTFVLRIVVIGAIFILGYLTSKITTTRPSTQKAAEIPKEATSSSSRPNRAIEEIAVRRVIDGDTIELVDGRRVRYIGVNTPETVDPRKPVECFGREASDENKRLVEGRLVQLEKDVSETDKYGRLLRYVYVGTIFVNDYLVRQGFARVETVSPDVRYADQFVSAQHDARDNNRGLWTSCP